MVFQNVFVKTGVRTRAFTNVRRRTALSTLVCSGIALLVIGVFCYLAIWGYAYHLSLVRHSLLKERSMLHQQYSLLRNQREVLHNPQRIRQQAESYGMVMLSAPQAIRLEPVVMAQTR